MKRYLIAGHFGGADKPSIPTSTDTTIVWVDFLLANGELGHKIGYALKDLGRMGIFPSDMGVDILILAAQVYAADTRISRQTESQDTWTREIHLVVPVSDPTRWTNASGILISALNFLTGDWWSIAFRKKTFTTPDKSKASQDCLITRFNSISLFSGGLDSLIGAIDLLEAGASPLLISHAGDSAASAAQEACFTGLKTHHSKAFLDRLRAWISFPKGLVQGVDSEDTTRGRSFLFFALGIFAGTGFGKKFTLLAPENGLIAINVPLDTLRLGSLSTRTTHPFYIARWNELLACLGINGTIENPYWNKTKGEMVKSCSNPQLLQKLLSSSISCSSPTKGRWRGRGIEHCGYCLPCLIRRAAISYGLGKKKDPTKYTISDLTARSLNPCSPEGQTVRSFQVAIEHLTSKPGIEAVLILKPGPLKDISYSNRQQLANVYRRGMLEVYSILNGVKTKPR